MYKYQIVLLDVDDTLLDNGRAERLALKSMVAAFGGVATDEDADLFMEENHRAWARFIEGEITHEQRIMSAFTSLFARTGVKGMDCLEQIELADETYRQKIAENICVFADTEMFLKRLSKNFTLVLATNGKTRLQRHKYETTLLQRYIPEERVFISESIGVSKPRKEFFEAIFQAFPEVSKDCMIMVGDNPHADILGANEAGIDTCWFNPHARHMEYDTKPTYEVRTLAEAAACIENAILEDD